MKKKNNLSTVPGILAELIQISKDTGNERYAKMAANMKEEKKRDPKRWRVIIGPDFECQGFKNRKELLDYIDNGKNTSRFEANLKRRGYKHLTVAVSFTYNVKTTVPARDAKEAAYRAATVTAPAEDELLGAPEVKTTVVKESPKQPFYLSE